MRYLLLFLMVGSVMAEDFKVEPIQYDIPESKWSKARWYENKGHCTDPMNLFDVCPNKGSLLFQKKVADHKQKLLLAKTKVNVKPITKNASKHV